MADRDPVAHLRTSMVEVRVGERLLPMKRALHCRVCNHPARGEIEGKLLLSESYPSIAGWTELTTSYDIDGVVVNWPPITATQLRNHVRRGHIPIDTQVLGQLVDARQKELGVDLTEATGMAVDGTVFAKLVLHQSMVRLQHGEIAPDITDGLAAAKLLESLSLTSADDTEMADRMQAMQDAMQRMFDVFRELVDESTWRKFADRLYSDPELAKIQERIRATDTTKELV